MTRKKQLIRLQRAVRDQKSGPGRPRILVIDPERIDGVVIDPTAKFTQVVMMDGTAIYVQEDPNEIIAECERLGFIVSPFTKEFAKEARRDCLE